MFNIKKVYNHTYARSVRVKNAKTTILTAFDCIKAFDSVWHMGLLHKCMKDGLPAVLIRFLKSWIQDRSLRVRIGQTLSEAVQF